MFLFQGGLAIMRAQWIWYQNTRAPCAYSPSAQDTNRTSQTEGYERLPLCPQPMRVSVAPPPQDKARRPKVLVGRHSLFWHHLPRAKACAASPWFHILPPHPNYLVP